MIKDIPMADICLDVNLQHREVSDEVVSRYKALIEDGYKLPPIDVVYDGKAYWLWDGYHRYQSHRKLGKKYICANVEEGSKRDAIHYSFNANSIHGVPRPKGTIEKIMRIIFADGEWSKDTNVAIAKWVVCTEGAVRYFKDKVEAEKAGKKPNASVKMGNQNPSQTTNSDSTKPASGAENAENDQNETSKETATVLLDSVGEIVPEKLVPIFARADEIKTHIRYLNKMLKEVKDARANNDLLYAYCNLNALESEVKNVTRNLRFTIPYAVCRYCASEGKDCRACSIDKDSDGIGFQNEQRYLTTDPSLKK